MQWLLSVTLVFLLNIQNIMATELNFSWATDKELAGQFVQEKHLTVLTQPFITKGHYHYSKSTGLSWKTDYPIVSEIRINSEGVSEVQPDGSLKSLTTDSQLSELLLAIFSGEPAILQQQFDIEQTENVVTLLPKVAQIAQVIEKITVHLDWQVIKEIILHEPAGNYTKIILTSNNSQAN
jgi:hypothetical protein